jgi:hypothetical protein
MIILSHVIDSLAQPNKNTILDELICQEYRRLYLTNLLSLHIVVFIKSPYQFDIMCLGVV